MELNKDNLLFEKIGKYEYVELNNELTIRYSLGDQRFNEYKKPTPKFRKKVVWFCILWILVVAVPSYYCFFNERYMQVTVIGVLLSPLVLLIAWGLYIGSDDLTYKKYYSLKLNKNGITEVWDFPEGKFEKTVLWKDVKYSASVGAIVSSTSRMIGVEFIVYSSEGTNEDYFRPIIKKAWDLVKYDIKLKDFEHTIFIYADGCFVEMIKLIDNYLIRNKIELSAMKE